MKIIVKKNLVIFRKPHEWEEISKKLIDTHGPSIMISWKMKRELGFTVRRHKGLVKHSEKSQYQEYHFDPDMRNKFYYEEQIHLDFWNDSAMTYFLLKYAKSDQVDF